MTKPLPESQRDILLDVRKIVSDDRGMTAHLLNIWDQESAKDEQIASLVRAVTALSANQAVLIAQVELRDKIIDSRDEENATCRRLLRRAIVGRMQPASLPRQAQPSR